MPNQFITADLTATYNIGANDYVTLLSNVTITSSSYGMFANHDDAFQVRVMGTVIGTYGIRAGLNTSGTSAGEIHITSTGYVGSTGFGDAIMIYRQSVDLINDGHIDSFDSGVYLASGVETGQIFNTGLISADSFGIIALGNSGSVNTGSIWVHNSGTIIGSTAVAVNYEHLQIENSGTIQGEFTGISMADHASQQNRLFLTNSGTVSAALTAINASGHNDEIDNLGLLSGAVRLNAGNDMLANGGRILGDVTMGEGNDVLGNSGDIIGDIDMGQGNDVFSNTGQVTGNVSTADGVNQVTNSGVIDGNLTLSGLGNTYNGYGGRVTGQINANSTLSTIFVDDPLAVISGGGGIERVHARADVQVWNVEEVYLYGTDDISVIANGTSSMSVTGNFGNNHIRLAAGNDVASGGAGDDHILGELGADSILGGAGNDVLEGGLDADTLNGSYGNDVVDGGNDADMVYGGGGDDTILGGDGNDQMFGMQGADLMSGDNGHDKMVGWAGNDTLDGGGGNDTIYGGTGDDEIYGGWGLDILFGGGGADAFVFTSHLDSSVGVSDRIRDFERGVDVIDLSDIGLDPFTWIDTAAFSGSGGMELRYAVMGSHVLAQFDMNGDGTEDGQIWVHFQTALAASDFVL